MYATAPARAYFPLFLTNQEIIASFYLNVLGRTADAEGLAFWTAQLNAAGATPGSVITKMIGVVANYTGTDPAGLTSQALYNNKVAVAQYYAEHGGTIAGATAILTTVTSDVATVTAAKASIDSAGVTGQTFSLTIGATDVVPGTTGNDTIIGQWGQSTTLQASDKVDGGAGTDTLRVVTDVIPGTVTPATISGFTVSNVEVLEVQAQNAFGTTLGLENVTGLTTLRSSSSTSALTVNNLKNIVSLDLQGSLGAPAVTVNYAAAAVAGTADVQNVSLNGNALGALTVDGVETMAITTATAASTVASLVGTTLKTVTVGGNQSLTVTAPLAATVTSVDASAQTAGGITVSLTNAANVAVKGGAGADTVTFTGALTSSDSFDGGAGRDTVVANLAEYTGSTYAVASKITTVETLQIADSLTTAFDAAKFTGDDTVVLAAGYATGTSVTGMESGYTLQVRGTNTGNTLTAAVTGSTSPNTADTLNLQIGQATSVAGVDRAVNAGTIATTGIESLTVLSNGTLATGTNAVVLSDTTATTASVTSVVITGGNGITVSSTNVGAASITNINASAATGNVNMNGLAVKSTGATIQGGAGADTMSGGAGADTITAGAGADTVNGTVGADNITLGAGKDKVVYTAATQSTTNSGVDVITDFVSGEDTFDITALLATTPGSFKGNQATFSAAQNSVVAADGILDVVYQQDEKVLWIDMNDDGLLNAADFRISLPNTASLTATDVGVLSTGNTITLTAAAAVVNTTTNTNADAKTTVYADTINSTIAFLAGSTIDGSASNDSLVLSTAGAVTLPATITNVETLVLASVGTTANTLAAFNDAGAFASVTGSSNADTLATTADIREGGSISLGAGADVITALALFETAAGADTSYKFNINMGADNDAVTTTTATTFTADSVLVGGDGTDTLTLAAGANISAGSVSGFETLVTGATATVSVAQYNAFTTITNGGTITLSNAGSINSAIGNLTLANGTNSITTASAGTQVITGGTGADTVKITAAWDQTNDSFTDATAADGDTFNIGYDVAGAINLSTAAGTLVGIENVVISVGQTAGYTLTLDADNKTLDTTASSTAMTLAAATAGMTSIKLGAGNDTITSVTANTAAEVIELGAGNDVITALNVGNFAMTVDSGAGNLTITDIAARGTGLLTLKFAAPATGTTTAASVAATTANLLVGDVLDFATDVTGVVMGAANGVNGVAGATGQLFIEQTGGNSIITFDADGSRTFTVGDVQLTIVGNLISGGIAGGNFVVGASA
ncbi:MAG: DUF4214 domain-containing protein [Ramlibacter sp.]|nr:DUF4214 domain-containing protein [Ramlibacter sp.]